MAKKYIEIVTKSSLEQTKIKVCSIKNLNTIKYIDNNIVSIIKINGDELLISRENDEYQLQLKFKEKEKTYGTYLLKENGIMCDLEIRTDKLVIDNNIYVKYKLENEVHEIYINEL